jgi:hypothetical protein
VTSNQNFARSALLFIVNFTLAVLVISTSAPFAQAQAVSASKDANGFPLWYEDANHVRVQPCLDPADPNCIVLADAFFDPAQPEVFPTNFPGEFFYFVADSDKVITPGCPAAGIAPGTALTRVAMEGSFVTGAPFPGDQIAFARIRIVVKGGLCPNTQYQFTHPYGTEIVTTDAFGGVVANKKGFTEDIGCLGAPCNFSQALTSRVFHGFLVSANAPAGYLGDAVTLATVTGGTNNFFRIQEMNGNVVAETSLFTVSGKLAGPLYASPSTVDFGGQIISTPSQSAAVTFTNFDQASLTIAGVGLTGANANEFSIVNNACAGQTLARDQSCTVGVIFTPSATGRRNAALSLAHNLPRSPVVVPVSGVGITSGQVPSVTITPSSIAFGNQRVHTRSAPQTITVSNFGSAPLGIFPQGVTVAITGADASQFVPFIDNCSGRFIDAGASCTVSVMYAPMIAGAHSANVAFADNASGSPQRVPVSGTGTGGIAAVSTGDTITPDPATLDPYGFPLWYRDENAITVQPCNDATDPYCVLIADPHFDPALPLSFPGSATSPLNYPSEVFYFVADSDKLNSPGCPASGIGPGRLKYRAAVEATFVTGVPIAGDQITFARTKIVADGLCPNTTYAFTHPYGTDLITTDSQGQVVANKKGGTIDIGCAGAPCNFADALSSRVFGGFLRFDPITDAPPGHLGDAGPVNATPHVVTGAPYIDPVTNTPANFFRLSDLAGRILAQTNLFTVSGKLAGTVTPTTTTITALPVTYPANAAVTVTVAAGTTVPTGSVSLTVDGGAATTQSLVGGSATFTLTSPSAGTHLLSATYTPTGSFSGSSAAGSLIVAAAPTSITIDAPAVTSPASGVVTVTVSSAAGTPTGSVQLTGPGGAFVQPLVNGSATFTFAGLTVGSYGLTASYPGQGNFAGSFATGTLVVNPPLTPTTTTITAPAITFPANGVVTVAVSSTGGIPTGVVSLTVDGGAALSQALVNGATTFTLTGLAVGSHTLAASYLSQGTFAASSATGTLVVNPASTTTIKITAPTVTYPANASVAVTVSSTAGTPTGSVSLNMDGGAATTLALKKGSATFALPRPNAGTHSLSVIYTPTGNFSAASAAGTLVVNPAATALSVSATAVTLPANGVVAVTVTSSAGTPLGSVSLNINGSVLSQTLSAAGQASFAIPLAAGSYPFTASYAAQGNFGASSASGTLVVAATEQITATATATVAANRKSANWSISGTTTQTPGNTITIRLANTGQTIGTAVPSNGNWSLNVARSAVVPPTTGAQISVTTSFTATPQMFPVTVK